MKSKKVVGILVFVIFSIALIIVNFFVYPFQSSSPNYSDVEASFNKISFPNDWTIYKTIENKGIAGRACPIEGSGCFSKQVFIKLPTNTDLEFIKNFLQSQICVSDLEVRSTKNNSINRYTFYCEVEKNIMLGSDYRVDQGEVSVRVFTK